MQRDKGRTDYPPDVLERLTKRDQLYFKFKRLLATNITIEKQILDRICKVLMKHSVLKKEVKDHYNPSNIPSARWWNITHTHIYHYNEIRTVLKNITEMESFLISRR